MTLQDTINTLKTILTGTGCSKFLKGKDLKVLAKQVLRLVPEKAVLTRLSFNGTHSTVVRILIEFKLSDDQIFWEEIFTDFVIEEFSIETRYSVPRE